MDLLKKSVHRLRRCSLLVLILMLAGGLRFWGINFGLPYTYASDEPSYLLIVLQMLKTGDLNPHWWFYPSLMFYLNAIVFAIYFLFGWMVGAWSTFADFPAPQIVAMGVGYLAMPSEFLVARGLTAVASTMAVVIVYLIGRKLHRNRLVALLAALLFTVSPTVIDHSHRIGPDIFALLFLLVSYLFTMRIVDGPKVRYYVMAGVGAGLAIASKYNAGLILIPLIVAHFLQFGFAGFKEKALYIGLSVAGLTFFIATPFAILDFPHFWEGVRFQIFSYTTEGHAGQEGNALQWYLDYLWQVENLVVLFGALGGIISIVSRLKKYLVLLSFPLIYFLFVSQLLTRNERTIMLILPFLCLLAAVFVVDVYAWLTNTKRLQLRQAQLGGVVLCVGIISVPLRTSVANNLRLTQIDSRETARIELESQLPSGTRIAQEAYSPYLDTRRFVIQGVDAIIDHPIEWYTQNGFEYIIFSQGMYARFFANPSRYGDFVEKYNAFFNGLTEVKHFDDNGFEIRIYKTNVVLPSHRVAARYGDYGELVELIGYNEVQWTRGNPLQVQLFWRTLGNHPEPFEVELRLLGQNDQEIAVSRSDLFQGKGWLTGMFDGIFTMPVVADAPPGEYRIQVSLIWTRFAYQLPSMTWSQEKLDQIFLGPIELNEATSG